MIFHVPQEVINQQPSKTHKQSILANRTMPGEAGKGGQNQLL